MRELVQPERGTREACLQVCFVGLVVRGNYVWCLSYLSYLWDLEEQRWGDTLKSSFGVAMQGTTGGGEGGRGGGGNFNGEGEEFPICNTSVLKLYCKSCWVL